LFAAAGDVLAGDEAEKALLEGGDVSAGLGGVEGVEAFREHLRVDVVEGVGVVQEPLPSSANGRAASISTSAPKTHRAALLRTLRVSVQPVAMSVPVRVQQNVSLSSPPSWPTRSISRNPGRCSSQSAQVRIGICDFSIDPGLVNDLPLAASRLNPRRASARRRSMVAADIEHNRSARSSSMDSSPWRRSEQTRSAKNGASRLPVIPSETAQALSSASTTSGP